MKASELRIGNLVYHFGNFMETLAIDTTAAIIKVNKIAEQVFYKDIHPIPITEEWLRKFGAEKRGLPNQFSINYITIELVEGGASVSPIDMYWIDVKHVHQLQNLYFSLTGEELTIKP